MEVVIYPSKQEEQTDALIVGLFEGDKSIQHPIIGSSVGEAIEQEIVTEEISGKLGDVLVLHRVGEKAYCHLVVVGLGKKERFSPATARTAAAAAMSKAREIKATTLAAIIFSHPEVEQTVKAMVEGFQLGAYRFTRYKTVKREAIEKSEIQTVRLIGASIEQDTASIEVGVKKGEAVSTAILNARDIVNEPPSKFTPASVVQAAQEIASLSPSISLTVLDKDELKKQGYVVLLAVASGSEEDPYLVHLHYKPKQTKRSIAFVGKGVTFDSGGLGIKPWNAMLAMKTDMAGGANVLGIFQALAELEAAGYPLPIEVHGIIPTTENMISGKAMRPDDILHSKSGKTIEVLHTDAEGRLILSDALTYAVTLKPQAIIDYATLTGAAIKALGRSFSAYMGNDKELLSLIAEASKSTGELAWELPLPESYHRYIESPVADLQNISTDSFAPDAIVAGLFLQEFVAGVSWAHIDIAGPSFTEDDREPLYPKGATGYGILLGLELLEKFSR